MIQEDGLVMPLNFFLTLTTPDIISNISPIPVAMTKTNKKTYFSNP